MDYRIEVVTLPVTDIDRAVGFYTRQAGFTLDVDYHPSEQFRVVQLTPPGSACSIQIGSGLSDTLLATARATCLVVTDIEAAHDELTARGVRVSEIRHKATIDDWDGSWQPGPDRHRCDYASFADFTDPDGNTWTLQEIGHRSP